MSHQLVQQFLNDLDRLRKLSGSLNEQTVREAFKDLLKAWARQENLLFVAELEYATSQKTKVYPDGTILHDLRVPLGFWESKDTKDDLDEEIRKKSARGYPRDNIIYENTDTAVLIQNGQEAFRCAMADTDALLKLLNLFFGWERPEIAEFRKAVNQFKADLPHVLDALREKINDAYDGNAAFQAEARRFLNHVKETVNPTLGEADVREMLIQHVLTEEIFAHVFNESDFHRENNIARELYKLEGAFFTGAVKKETLKTLEPYYAAIRANAAQISNHQEKQTFLKLIYENFYKIYDKKKADTLGVVYTPNEIVRFMIEGADWLTEKHFGKKLIDGDVEILDPATGTGTFICELIEYFRGQPEKLAHKYRNELHANEVAILPYYVANLNIEATYAAVTGQFAEFPSLCFVDTLDNVEGLGIRAGQQMDLLGGLSDENIERVKRQNRRKISVVIGNPPYNPRQEYYNQGNANRAYNRIDQTIKDTYIRLGTAQNKNTVYDMYTRFFRWASDRLHDDGIIAFITNRNFISKAAFDGFRKSVATEFAEIWVLDLGGDVRDDPRLSGTKHNVFGIQTGVAISFLVKKRGKRSAVIRYANRPEMETADAKLAFLAGKKLHDIPFQTIVPSKTADWVDIVDNDWEQLLPLCSKEVKAGKSRNSNAIFRLFSLGNASHRDEWVYDTSRDQLEQKVRYLIQVYEECRIDPTSPARESIRWDRELEKYRKAGIRKNFDPSLIVRAAYRPFTPIFLYFDRHLNGMTYQLPDMFSEKGINRVISFSSIGYRADYCVSSWNGPVDLHYGAAADGYQVVSRYRYTEDGERVDNITDWALKRFREAYGKDVMSRPAISPLAGEMSAQQTEGGEAADTESGAIPPSAPVGASPPQGGRSGSARSAALSKDDIFHYVYGVLHDPVYREKYAINLKREFPRIPFYPDFRQWAEWGERLMALHIGYETVEPWPLERIDEPDEKARDAGVAPKTMLRSDRDNGTIRLDSETQLTGIPPEVWTYRLGNRSALDWILDQYKEKTPRDPTIREKFNTYRFADYKEHVIDLLARVTRVSVETVAITEAMKKAKRG
ncbi:type ISP restriction/modification enzyme [Hoeflea olei]|uniref:site-specific DNA-methyltransferase (adenine-specific) n=1 Tax=Hoeflea olei TaxID=1480615 RepID=A0A1C1YV45_9HYPH|nr:type ISP restriction/modification enzyme [Hoeflea olei]OCW57210.1 DNA methyltransferase [Hoeflea olei]